MAWLRYFKHLRRSFELVRCAGHCRNPLTLTLAYVRVKKLAYPYIVQFRNNTALSIADHSELTTLWHVYFGLEYTVRSDYKTVIDLGANIGAFSVWIAAKCPAARVLAVEPFPSTVVKLKDNIERNALCDRITCSAVAACSADGVLKFDASPEIYSYSRSSVLGSPNANTLPIEAMSLARLIDATGSNRIDLLKIDVEGGEYDLLLNTNAEVLRRCHEVVVEYHGFNDPRFPQQPKDIQARMQEIGFMCMRMEARGWSGIMEFALL